MKGTKDLATINGKTTNRAAREPSLQKVVLSDNKIKHSFIKSRQLMEKLKIKINKIKPTKLQK
jgi:hypothetical protein